MAKRKSNTEFLVDVMDFSRHGALMQVFILDGLAKWAEQVAASTPADYPKFTGVHPESWIACGKELKAKLDERYEKPVKPLIEQLKVQISTEQSKSTRPQPTSSTS
jgi:hypothetical protein